VCDYKCATDAITGYMVKFAGDCNNDGIINCEDYKHIHQNGYVDCQRQVIKEEDIKYDIDIRGGFDD
jgi:Destabilase